MWLETSCIKLLLKPCSTKWSLAKQQKKYRIRSPSSVKGQIRLKKTNLHLLCKNSKTLKYNLVLKVLRALPAEWDLKVMAMRESKNLSKMNILELFSYLKTCEFEMDRMKEKETSTSMPTALVAVEKHTANSSGITEEDMTLLMKKFKKFIKKDYKKQGSSSRRPSIPQKVTQERTPEKFNTDLCYNCRRPRYFIRVYYCTKVHWERKEIKKRKTEERQSLSTSN